MNTQDKIELNQWIAVNVMYAKPRTEARAVNPKTGGMTLCENDTITRRDVREFCIKHPEYKCVIADVWPDYTTVDNAMQVLKKCAEKVHMVAIENTASGMWSVCKLQCHDLLWCDFTTLAETLELAICLFAKKLFSKWPFPHRQPTLSRAGCQPALLNGQRLAMRR